MCQKQSVYARKLSKGKLQQESFSTWLERGLDFVHIHYYFNRILAKRGARTSPLSPPWIRHCKPTFCVTIFMDGTMRYCSEIYKSHPQISRPQLVAALQQG